MTVSPATVFFLALLTALATGLGAVPFLLFRRAARSWLGVSNAIASGLMLAASFGLIYEGALHGVWRVIGGLLLGLIFIVESHRRLANNESFQVGNLRGVDAVKALMILGIMTTHSFTEGVGIGVSFGGGEALGIFITVAILVHNIPEGLAISLVLVPRGETPWRAAGWSVFSSLPQPLLAVPAFLFVEAFRPILPVGLGFAGGAMIWMVFAELIPDALDDSPKHVVATTVTVSAAAMVLFQVIFRG